MARAVRIAAAPRNLLLPVIEIMIASLAAGS